MRYFSLFCVLGFGWFSIPNLRAEETPGVHLAPESNHWEVVTHSTTEENSSSHTPPPTHDTKLWDHSSVKTLVEILRRHVETQSWDVTRALVERILILAPQDGREVREALLIAARQAAANGQHGESILFYERWCMAGGSDPHLPQILVELGRGYRQVGAIKSAMDTFYKAMRVGRSSKDVDTRPIKTAQWEVAETAFQTQDWERARKLFEMLVESYREEDLLIHSAYYRMGDCSRALGNMEQAIIDYDRALAHADKHPFASEARLALLEIFLKKDKPEIALRHLNEFTNLVSSMSAERSYWKRRSGEVLFRYVFQQDSKETPLNILDHLEKIDSDPAWKEQIAYWRGLVYLGQTDWEKAFQSFSLNTEDKSPSKEVSPKKNAKDNPQVSETKPSEKYAEICKWILDFQRAQEKLQLPPPTLDREEITNLQ